jgi:NAD(P)-dependent dehydrogenase (short-subunit alcohol dehydrogenase family)
MSNKLDFSKDLTGRRALVTGGTRGIGAAIVQRLLDAGAKVVVTARSRGQALPAGAAFVAGDVASVSGVKEVAAGALEALGGLDILVNNAGGGTGFPQGTASIPDEEWQAGFALNLFAAIRLTNALLPSLRESKAGAIVNISSGAATMSVGAVAHYCAAKAALNSYSRTLAIDLAPSKVA